ncbi:MAG: class I SAM-dependent methyltransferase [Nitrososphaera sp.]|nr:class I SAM-dependent methyltransferase [Nitrososphaera sp.]
MAAQVVDPFPDVKGMTSAKIKFLLNGLVSQLPADEGYFEVGIHMGATLVGALAGHQMVDATACDNWSQFEKLHDGSAKAFFFENIKRHQDKLPAIRVIDGDVWNFLKDPKFAKPLGIVFYDGDHKQEDQRRIFSTIYPYLAKESIVLIDDYEHPPVKAGTEAGLKDIACTKMEIIIKPGKEGYHNGLGIFWLVK